MKCDKCGAYLITQYCAVCKKKVEPKDKVDFNNIFKDVLGDQFDNFFKEKK